MSGCTGMPLTGAWRAGRLVVAAGVVPTVQVVCFATGPAGPGAGGAGQDTEWVMVAV